MSGRESPIASRTRFFGRARGPTVAPAGAPLLDVARARGQAPGPLDRIAQLLAHEPTLREAGELIAADKARRTPRRSTPNVLAYAPSQNDEGIALVPPGTVTLFLAPAGAPLLDEVRRTFAAPNRAAVDALLTRVRAAAADRPRVAPLDLARRVVRDHVHADLQYDGRTLVEHLALPIGAALGVVSLPYDGSVLDDVRFELVEFVDASIGERLEAVLVRRPPALTDAERAAPTLAPASMLELSTGTVGLVAFTPLALFVIAALAMHTPATGRLPRTMHLRPLDDGRARRRLDELGPRASARELMALRRELQGAQG